MGVLLLVAALPAGCPARQLPRGRRIDATQVLAAARALDRVPAVSASCGTVW